MRITIDPVSRLSSNMRINVELTNGSVSTASSAGMSYRGFEQMLLNKEPLDAPYFTQRICGMCSSPHATASVNALESAFEAASTIPKDALVVRNILNGLAWMKNHIEHIYIGFMPDLADTTYQNALQTPSPGLGNYLWNELSGRFSITDGSAYLDALKCIKLIGRAEGILGGRSPGSPVIVPGGVTTRPTQSDVYELNQCMAGISSFLQSRLLGELTIDEWLQNTHDAGTQEYAYNYLQGLPMSNSNPFLTPDNGWGDMLLFMMFCSKMLASDTLNLPAYISLDNLGGYPLDDQLIGFLSYGSFYTVRDSTGNFVDGYTPVSDDQAPSYQMTAGFTSGSMQNILVAAEKVDSTLLVEQVAGSFYEYSSGSATSLSPLTGQTSPLTNADDISYDGTKYSFIKAPRYGLVPCEVGPLARLINSRERLIIDVMQKLYQRNSASSSNYPMASVYTRMVARMQETLVLSRMVSQWINNDLEISSNGRKYSLPVSKIPNSTGIGLMDAPRGALGHWLKVDGSGAIANYQVIAPTTWNASPRDSQQKSGPIELALMGSSTTPSGYIPGSETDPVGLYHVVRSFDPCVACAVHAIKR
jgi:hydrogenase large subunit